MNLYMHTVSLNKLNPIISETLDSLEQWPKCRYDFVAIICPRALVVGCVLIQPSDSHSPPLSAQSPGTTWGGTEMTIGQKIDAKGKKGGNTVVVVLIVDFCPKKKLNCVSFYAYINPRLTKPFFKYIQRLTKGVVTTHPELWTWKWNPIHPIHLIGTIVCLYL